MLRWRHTAVSSSETQSDHFHDEESTSEWRRLWSCRTLVLLTSSEGFSSSSVTVCQTQCQECLNSKFFGLHLCVVKPILPNFVLWLKWRYFSLSKPWESHTWLHFLSIAAGPCGPGRVGPTTGPNTINSFKFRLKTHFYSSEFDLIFAPPLFLLAPQLAWDVLNSTSLNNDSTFVQKLYW